MSNTNTQLICQRFGNYYLPPKELRPCGDEFQDDKFYFDSACREARRLKEKLGVTLQSSVLDVGCGVGRLAMGIIEEMGEISKYKGLDICHLYVKWCQQFISLQHPNFQFILLNMHNDRYNKNGVKADSQFKLDFVDEEFDVIYLYSVFSHMAREDVEFYMREFRRIITPNGKIFMTAFIEENVPDMTINPENYRMIWKGDLHCVRYSKSYFEGLLRENGFSLSHFEYERETDGQSGLYISRT